MSGQVTIAIIGKGKVGSSFAMKIAKMKPKYTLFAHLPARKKTFAELSKNGGPQVIFICCKDDKISAVAKKTLKAAGKNLAMLIHCAGSRESTILPTRPAVERLMLHPIQTFATPDGSLLNNIYFAASSDNKQALSWAKKFVNDMGGAGMLVIPGDDLALYHTLVVFASNFTTLLGGSIELLSHSLQIPPATMKKAVAPLMRTSLENVLKEKAARILTGPIARKDNATLRKHRLALRSEPLALSKVYEGFVMLAHEITEKK